jgi:hypothetical protein
MFQEQNKVTSSALADDETTWGCRINDEKLDNFFSSKNICEQNYKRWIRGILKLHCYKEYGSNITIILGK